MSLREDGEKGLRTKNGKRLRGSGESSDDESSGTLATCQALSQVLDKNVKDTKTWSLLHEAYNLVKR